MQPAEDMVLGTGDKDLMEVRNNAAAFPMFGRINYAYDDKYLAEFSIRRMDMTISDRITGMVYSHRHRPDGISQRVSLYG